MNESKEFLGDAEVTVRFVFDPECLGHGAHPDYPAYVCIDTVLINGEWVSGELLSPDWVERTENLILAEKGRSLQAEHDMSAWEARQERLMEEGYP